MLKHKGFRYTADRSGEIEKESFIYAEQHKYRWRRKITTFPAISYTKRKI